MTMKYVQTIWQAVLMVMHGRKLHFNPACPTGKALLFYFTVRAHADYIAVSDDVWQMLEDCILDIPNIWESVRHNAGYYLHLAWQLENPELYLDAARHITGQTPLHQLRHGRFSQNDLVQWPSPDESSTFDQEMLSLLYAGARDLRDEQMHLTNLMVQLVASNRDSLFLEGTGTHLGGGQRMRQMVGKVKALLRGRVLYFARLVHEANSEYVRYHHDLRQNFERLRRYLRSRSDAALERKFHLRHVASDSRFYLPKLREMLKSFMTELDFYFSESKLFEHPNHHFIPVSPWGLWKNPKYLHPYFCQRCCRAKFDDEKYFAWLEPRTIFPSWSDKPWPLSGNFCSHKKRRSCEEVELTSASFEWLSEVGLGETFKYLQSQKERVKPQLSILTEVTDYPGSALTRMFDDETESDSDGAASYVINDSPPLSSVCSKQSDEDDANVDDLLLRLSNHAGPTDPLANKFENIHLNTAAMAFMYKDNSEAQMLARQSAPCNCYEWNDMKLNKSRMRFSTEEPGDKVGRRYLAGIDDV